MTSDAAPRLDWTDVVDLASRLADLITRNRFAPELIIAIARGGWIPARLLSELLGVHRIASIGLIYLDDERSTPTIYSAPEPIHAGTQVLLIEDALESGRSLVAAREYLEAKGAAVRTACFYISPSSIVRPDFFVEAPLRIPVMPWEQQRSTMG